MRVAALLVLVAPMAHAADIAAIELKGETNAGEGSRFVSVYFKNGCYLREAVGGSGGGGRVHDSEAGCAAPAVLAPLFAAAEKGETDARGIAVTLVDSKGARTEKQVSLPLEDLKLPTWYAPLPSPPVGRGPQLLAINREKGRTRLQATLTADGSVWCLRTVPATGGDPVLPKKRLEPLKNAAALLGKILAGVTAAALEGDADTGVEAALAGGERQAVRKQAPADEAYQRFVEQLGALGFPTR
jgi:hypothetical protein